MDFASIQSLINQNQFLSGGLVLGALGGVIAYGKSIPRKIYNFLLNRIFITTEIDQKSGCYIPITRWLEQHEQSRKFKQTKIDVKSEYNRDTRRHDYEVRLIPTTGNYILKYKNKKFYISLTQKETSISFNNESIPIGRDERIFLKTFFWNRSLFKEIIQEALENQQRNKIDKIITWVNEGYNWFPNHQGLYKRSRNSLCFAEGLIDSLESDIQSFLDKKQWYKDNGIPYRRGFMFEGPPGGGKTSLAIYLAGRFDLDLYVLNLSSCWNSIALTNAMSRVDPRSIVLIEDLDTEGIRREKEENKISLGTLLNSLDGAMAGEDRILIVTTNRKEQLDPALIRPGRIDRSILIDNADRFQIRSMFSRFFPEEKEKVEKIAVQLPEKKISVCRLQEFILENKTIDQCLQNVGVLK